MGYYDRYQGRNSRRPRGNAPVNEPQRRPSTLGVLFNPQFGTSFRALKETGRMFIHMIALIFAQANLIDPRHPAVTNTGRERYSLLEIVNLAWQRVEWRQENFAQCALFVAVVACIGLCALTLAYAFFTLLFGLS
jgi:hypothetical protein